MSSVHASYLTQRVHAWTRVDMLIALYESGIRTVERLIEAHRTGDAGQVAEHRSKAIRIVLELVGGLDHSHGDLPHQLARLCEYMQHALLTGDDADYHSVRHVLVTLRDAFEEIRGEAAKLEQDGNIPPIERSPIVKLNA